MEDLFLRHIGAALKVIYSKTQSSYCSISFMQGVVSNTGGTEAGMFPKYRNDIYIYQLIVHEPRWQTPTHQKSMRNILTLIYDMFHY